jgi:hypothetical protein
MSINARTSNKSAELFRMVMPEHIGPYGTEAEWLMQSIFTSDFKWSLLQNVSFLRLLARTGLTAVGPKSAIHHE